MSGADLIETGPIVGLLHPGEMGASVGGALRAAGVTVRWAATGRSADTRARADAFGLLEVSDLDGLLAGCHVVISICPPDRAMAVATSVARHRFSGLYVDANAIAPSTAAAIARVVVARGARFVDGDLIGGPVGAGAAGGGPRLFLSGADADSVARLFAATPVTPIVIGSGYEASALKMCYAAWTKGTAALLLAIRALAQSSGVETALLEEWSRSQPGLGERSDAATGVAGRAWRFAGEMAEIGRAFDESGLPDGFGLAASDVYARLAGFKYRQPSAQEVVEALGRG